MNKLNVVAVVAPLAMLVACGEPPVEEEEVALDPAGLGLEETQVEGEMPQPTENALETIDYSGTYVFTGLDGSESTLTLDAEDGTYSYEGAGGTSESGEYETLDGSRIFIEEIGGRNAWFSVADGALYRLPNEDTAYDDVDPGSIWILQ